ncbi:MAG: hypothetical protein KA020_12285, partial [Planctomycetes bacterium]|nr:hypothetical protein [Planctomycetota bacterium]
IKALANKVIHVAGGKLTHYQGDYEFFLHKTKSTSARASLTAGGAAAPQKQVAAKKQQQQPSGGQKEQQKAKAAQLKQLRQTVQKLEAEIEQLETQKAEIETQLAKPEVWNDGPRSGDLSRQLQKIEARLKVLSPQWETQAVQLEALEKE